MAPPGLRMNACLIFIIFLLETKVGWKYFLSEIYRPIFQAREFFCTMPGKISPPIFFLFFCFPPPITFLMVRPLAHRNSWLGLY